MWKYVDQTGNKEKIFYGILLQYYNISKEAATFFYNNRYTAFEECTDPCETMDLSISYQGSFKDIL